jgi:integrase
MTFGRHGDITAEQARKEAEAYRGEIRKGVDIASLREEERHRLTADTLADAIERYLALNEKPGRYWREVRRLLLSDDLKPLRKKPVPNIRRADVVALLDKVTMRSPAVARSLYAALNPLFRWAVQRGIVEASPMDGMAPPRPLKARDRVLSDAEIAAFWQATGAMGFPFGSLFRLLLLTGQRRNEVAGMRWREIDWQGATWTLPGERTKNGKPHLIDLSPQVLAILESLPRNGELVFSTTGDTPVSGFSKAKARLDARMADLLDGDLPEWRTHDLRRTAASGLARLGFPPQVIERILNHLSGAQGGLTAVYQRHEYRDERRAAMLTWGREVTRITSGDEYADNVVELRQHG